MAAAGGERLLSGKEGRNKEGRNRMKNAVIHYTDTTSPEAVDMYVRKWSRETQRTFGWKRKRRRRHMKRQTAAGLALLAITIPAVYVMDGDATIAAVTIPAGIGLMLDAKEGL